jgi:hypothetical protein
MLGAVKDAAPPVATKLQEAIQAWLARALWPCARVSVKPASFPVSLSPPCRESHAKPCPAPHTEVSRRRSGTAAALTAQLCDATGALCAYSPLVRALQDAFAYRCVSTQSTPMRVPRVPHGHCRTRSCTAASLPPDSTRSRSRANGRRRRRLPTRSRCGRRQASRLSRRRARRSHWQR